MPKLKLIASYTLSLLPSLLLLFSAYMKFFPTPEMLEQTAKSGLRSSLLTPLGILELSCTLLYLFPPTSILGAILLTGYLGGATWANLSQSFSGMVFFPPILGILLWAGLYLRNQSLQSLIPLRTRK